MYFKNHLWQKKRNRIGSLLSHLGILDDEFEKILAAYKLSEVGYWYKNLGCVLKHIDIII